MDIEETIEEKIEEEIKECEEKLEDKTEEIEEKLEEKIEDEIKNIEEKIEEKIEELEEKIDDEVKADEKENEKWLESLMAIFNPIMMTLTDKMEEMHREILNLKMERLELIPPESSMTILPETIAETSSIISQEAHERKEEESPAHSTRVREIVKI